MSWRGTVALTLLAGLALAFLFFSDHTRTHSPEEPLLGIDPSLAENIRIQEGGSSFSLIKKNGLWNIQGDIHDRADPSLIHALLSAAADITPLDQLDARDLKGKVDLSTLRLKEPDRTLTIHDRKDHTLYLGVEGPAPDQLYARLDAEKKVFLISGKIASIAFLPALEYRDKRLTSLAVNQLEEVSVTKGAMQQLRLKKDQRGWLLESPLSAQGDEQSIDTWLHAILSAHIEHWLPEGVDASSRGFDAPAEIVTLREEGETQPLTITIGASVPEAPGSFFVRCSGRPGIAVIPGLYNALNVTPQSLRTHKIPQVEYDTIDKITICENAKQLTLIRKPESDDWILSEGSRVISGNLLKEWFEKFQNLPVLSFEPATPEHLQQRGLDQPVPPVTMRFIAHLSENTAQENAGEVILAAYAFGFPSGGEIALREGTATDLLILPESAGDLIFYIIVGKLISSPPALP